MINCCFFGCRCHSPAHSAAADRDDLVRHSYLSPFWYRATAHRPYPLYGESERQVSPFVGLRQHCRTGRKAGRIRECHYPTGPLDVKTSCEKTSGDIKGIVSPINGEADVLIFPNIESGNAFYKPFPFSPMPIWQVCFRACLPGGAAVAQ